MLLYCYLVDMGHYLILFDCYLKRGKKKRRPLGLLAGGLCFISPPKGVLTFVFAGVELGFELTHRRKEPLPSCLRE